MQKLFCENSLDLLGSIIYVSQGPKYTSSFKKLQLDFFCYIPIGWWMV